MRRWRWQSSAAMLSKQRFVTASCFGLFSFCLLHFPTCADHGGHLVFNKRIADAAAGAISRHQGSSSSPSAASWGRYYKGLAEWVLQDVKHLRATATIARIEELNYRFAALVWPIDFLPGFLDIVTYGHARPSASKRGAGLWIKQGVAVFNACHSKMPPEADQEFGFPCPNGNSVYTTGVARQRQRVHCMLFYHQLTSLRSLNPAQPLSNVENFQASIRACARLAQDTRKRPQIDLNEFADCVLTKSKNLPAIRGFAAVMSYMSGENLHSGSAHEVVRSSFGFVNPGGAILIDHLTVAVKLAPKLAEVNDRYHLPPAVPQHVAVYFILDCGN